MAVLSKKEILDAFDELETSDLVIGRLLDEIDKGDIREKEAKKIRTTVEGTPKPYAYD